MKKLYSRRDLLAILAGAALAGKGAAARGSSPLPASGRVVTARYAGPGDPDYDLLGVLLDRSIAEMTGTGDAADAWCSLFSPGDHVSVKVNCLGGPGMSTNPLLVRAVTDRLAMCGVKRNRIIIWDRMSRELEEGGFELSRGGSGVQCYGTDDVGYGRDLLGQGSVASLFSGILVGRCNKVINMPVLKDHGLCGVTFAMKNYFGAIHNPNKYHLNHCDPYIGDLNSMSIIRAREALIIGDLTRIQADGGPSFKNHWAVRHNGILVGTDPVSVDNTALEILEMVRKDLGRPDLASRGSYPDYIKTAADKGVGNPERTKKIELTI